MFLESPLYLLISLLALPLAYRAYRNEKREWKLVNLSYILVIVLLAVAAASPQVQTSASKESNQELVYLVDESRSMTGTTPNISISGVDVERRTMVSGNSSRIDRAMMSFLEPGKTYLISSDFRASEDMGEVIQAFRSRNATVHVLDHEMPEEYSVSVSGPSITVPGASNTFEIDLSSTSDKKKDLEVRIDGEQAETQQTENGFEIERDFDEKGYHRVVAEVRAEDKYESNNKFYKTVKVVEKPEILVVGEDGQLGDHISEFFSITHRSSVPDDLSEYYTVVLKKKPGDTQELKSYLVEGNGMVYTGNGAFDVLPVERTEESEDTENPSVVLSIDMSEGLGECKKWLSEEKKICTQTSSEGGSFANSRNFAFNVVANLRGNRPGTVMGALVYNQSYFPMHSPEPLRKSGADLQDKIRRIGLNGIAYHRLGVEKSAEMFDGAGNIILITDGKVPNDGGTYGPEGFETFQISDSQYRDNLVEVAEDLPSNVRLFTVAVGDEKKTEFLERLARAGGGVPYESPEEFYQQPPTFVGGGGTAGNEILKIVSSDHFITRGMAPLKLATSRFDTVEPRPSADLLVSSTGGKPALTSWRYGLGRVASFSAGDRDLSNFMSQEPQLVARTLSWASGNPQRKKEKTVNIESGSRGGSVNVEATYRVPGLTRKSENLYMAEIQPSGLGFHSFEDHSFAYNYREEIKELGYDQDLMKSLTSATGGKIVKPSEAETIESTVPVVERKTVENRSLSAYFLLAALLVFLAQIGYRKLNGEI
jgi:hypothetical protein